ncbi:Na(+)/H(+) antiporter subunit B [Actinomadura gamaensis]|uniref:Na(+)/H(+) antiporter subunit B n=1 Tax=Actinomadura gamaensis TaxID=1763541 RepID=A0ABV9U713_9ACTN
MFWAIDYLVLALVLAGGVLTVRIRSLNGAVMALSSVGVLLGLLFIVLGAPDVAHAQLVVGAIALPVLYLIAIGKTRTDVPEDDPSGAGTDRTEEAARCTDDRSPEPS